MQTETAKPLRPEVQSVLEKFASSSVVLAEVARVDALAQADRAAVLDALTKHRAEHADASRRSAKEEQAAIAAVTEARARLEEAQMRAARISAGILTASCAADRIENTLQARLNELGNKKIRQALFIASTQRDSANSRRVWSESSRRGKITGVAETTPTAIKEHLRRCEQAIASFHALLEDATLAPSEIEARVEQITEHARLADSSVWPLSRR